MSKMYAFLGLFAFALAGTALKHYVFPSHNADWITDTPIAHRGYCDNEKGIPENSLLAFENTIKNGYAIEIDVMLTKDGEVLVYHDQDLKRLSSIDKRVDSLTLQEIQSHKLLKTNEVPPTLKQVLDLVQGQVPLYIEIKREDYVPADDLEVKVAELIKDYKGKLAIISFNPASLEWFAQNAPQHYRGQNYEPDAKHSLKNYEILGKVLGFAWITKPHFLIYNHANFPREVLRILTPFRSFISYNVYSKKDYDAATSFAQNVIFDNLKL